MAWDPATTRRACSPIGYDPVQSARTRNRPRPSRRSAHPREPGAPGSSSCDPPAARLYLAGLEFPCDGRADLARQGAGRRSDMSLLPLVASAALVVPATQDPTPPLVKTRTLESRPCAGASAPYPYPFAHASYVRLREEI